MSQEQQLVVEGGMAGNSDGNQRGDNGMTRTVQRAAAPLTQLDASRGNMTADWKGLVPVCASMPEIKMQTHLFWTTLDCITREKWLEAIQTAHV